MFLARGENLSMTMCAVSSPTKYIYVDEGALVRKFSSVLIIYNMNEYEVYMTVLM